MRPFLKGVLLGLALVLLVSASVAVFIFEYGSPVERGGLRIIRVSDHSTSRPPTVSIDGGIISSSLAVSSVSQRREGDCVVIFVWQGIIRPGRRSGRFHLDVDVSNGITEIAYRDPRDIIWQR
jgi:hypothetical protein